MGENKLAGEFLRIQLKDYYEKLIREIKESHNNEEKIAGLAPLVGSNYTSSRSKLLVCGRAVNGWKSLDLSRSDADIYEMMCNIHPEDRVHGCELNWIKRSRLNWDNNIKNGYNYRKSSFWNGTRDVLKALEGGSEMAKKNWPSLLAWSNIYKISPAKTGNPNNELRRIQIPQCKVILQKEIELLQPKNILFITGDWGKNILHSLGIWPDYKSKNIVLFANTVTFLWKNKLTANVVVVIRPERQKRNKWVKDVISSFGNMSKNA